MNNHSLVIDVKNLNKSFGANKAVVDFSLALKPGQICGFLGPNGSGKTTSLRMLCGLLTPDSGEGQCLGFDILKNSQDIKMQVGYMPQRFSLYESLSVYENLEFIARLYQIKQRKDKIKEVLDTFNFGQYKDHLAKHLSGGWKQRLALASCLLHDPKLLLLDEPTAGVDPKTRRDFWDDLFTLSRRGITTLVSTHYMDEAERCSYLIYILYGHVLIEGTAEDILRKAQLTIWMATGKNLTSLEQKLKNAPGVDAVAFFGDKLHVSSKNEALLMNSLLPYKEEYTWERIDPTLEDAFMSFIKDV